MFHTMPCAAGSGTPRSLTVPLPVALVVPKIDVLAGQSYALPDGGDAIARFYDELLDS